MPRSDRLREQPSLTLLGLRSEAGCAEPYLVEVPRCEAVALTFRNGPVREWCSPVSPTKTINMCAAPRRPLATLAVIAIAYLAHQVSGTTRLSDLQRSLFTFNLNCDCVRLSAASLIVTVTLSVATTVR